MANIYELTGAYKALEMAIALNPDEEEFKAQLAEINDALEEKADNYAKLMKNLDADIEGIDAEMKRLAALKKSKQNFKGWLKGNLFDSMKATGKTKFKTQLFSFGIQRNGGKQPLILTVDPKDLPAELQKVTVEADNEKIREYIAETGDLSYAVLGEQGESLRIR